MNLYTEITCSTHRQAVWNQIALHWMDFYNGISMANPFRKQCQTTECISGVWSDTLVLGLSGLFVFFFLLFVHTPCIAVNPG